MHNALVFDTYQKDPFPLNYFAQFLEFFMNWAVVMASLILLLKELKSWIWNWNSSGTL